MTSLHEWRQAADESLRRSRERRTGRSLAPLVIALAILAALIATLVLNSVQHL